VLKKLAIYLFTAALLVSPAAIAADEGAASPQGRPKVDEAAIERFVQAELEKARSPGAAVVVVSGDRVVYANGFGLADREAGIPATSSTLFQLGSTSKAFTGLALLELEQQGALRLDDPVARYLPWLRLNDEGQAAQVTLAHLLHHTSGVPFDSIASIPEDSGEQALERTVRALSGTELDAVPGSKYQYATINYDVLGLVIQEVSGMSYEAYMSRMLQRLGLHDTMPMAQLNERRRLAAGYKIGFGSPRLYQAPDYRGNTPAGYLLSNADDIGRWLLLQLGTADISASDRAIIERSHRPDTAAGPDENGAYYAAGWFVSADGKEISHQGSNPNFSSYIILRPQDRLGVGVLANINSAYTFHIGAGLMSLLQDREPPPAQADFYPQLDRMAMIGLAIIAVSLIVLAAAAARIPLQLRRKRRAFVPPRGRRLAIFVAAILTAGAFFWGIGKLLDKVFAGLPLDVAAVWCPVSVIWFIYAFSFAAGTAFLFFGAVWLLPKVRRPPLPIPAEEVK